VSVAGMCLSAFMLLVPVAYEKYDKFVRLARALKEVRVGFILTGTGVTFSLLIACVLFPAARRYPLPLTHTYLNQFHRDHICMDATGL